MVFETQNEYISNVDEDEDNYDFDFNFKSPLTENSKFEIGYDGRIIDTSEKLQFELSGLKAHAVHCLKGVFASNSNGPRLSCRASRAASATRRRRAAPQGRHCSGRATKRGSKQNDGVSFVPCRFAETRPPRIACDARAERALRTHYAEA